MSFQTLVYGLCSLAFIGLGALAATRWRDRVGGSRLAAAFWVQALWAALYALPQLAAPTLFVSVEMARGLAWLLVLALPLIPLVSPELQPRVIKTLWLVGSFTIVLPLASPALLSAEALLPALSYARSWGGLLTSIAGLVLVEQVARNTREDARWNLKYLWLGIGLIFAADLGAWSLALLGAPDNGAIDEIRAVLNLLVAGLIVVALRRISVWNGTHFKSSGAFFFNTTLVLAGGYVLLMAGASYLIHQQWRTSSSIVNAVFIGAALVLLAVALFSDQFRAWARVTLAKYVRPYRYDYRDVWLRLTRALTESSDVPLHDRVSMVMGSFVNSGSACLWVRDGDGDYRRAGGSFDISSSHTIPHDAFLEDLRRRDWIYDLADPRFESRTNNDAAASMFPPPPAWLSANQRAWLVVPLVCNEAMVGFFVIARPLAPTPLDWEHLDILRAAGRQVASYLAFEQAANRLAEMHQFEALNRLSAFVMHDLRHLVAQLALVVDNASRHRTNPEFIDDAILTIDSSVGRMQALMETLRAGAIQEPERRVDLAEMGRDIQQRCAHRTPVVEVEVESRSVEVLASRERLMQSLEHLVRNAQEATPGSGSVRLRISRGQDTAVVEIIDTGCGMDAEFVRTRLFKPFDSTKGQAGMGLGAHEAREIVRKLGGSLRVESRPNAGTRFVIELPLAPKLAS